MRREAGLTKTSPAASESNRAWPKVKRPRGMFRKLTESKPLYLSRPRMPVNQASRIITMAPWLGSLLPVPFSGRRRRRVACIPIGRPSRAQSRPPWPHRWDALKFPSR